MMIIKLKIFSYYLYNKWNIYIKMISNQYKFHADLLCLWCLVFNLFFKLFLYNLTAFIYANLASYKALHSLLYFANLIIDYYIANLVALHTALRFSVWPPYKTVLSAAVVLTNAYGAAALTIAAHASLKAFKLP
jgi:hypothetical protein